MKKVVEIVGTNIPDLEAVDLSENRLHSLDGVVPLLHKAPNIKLLHLSKNKVPSHKYNVNRNNVKLIFGHPVFKFPLRPRTTGNNNVLNSSSCMTWTRYDHSN